MDGNFEQCAACELLESVQESVQESALESAQESALESAQELEEEEEVTSPIHVFSAVDYVKRSLHHSRVFGGIHANHNAPIKKSCIHKTLSRKDEGRLHMGQLRGHGTTTPKDPPQSSRAE